MGQKVKSFGGNEQKSAAIKVPGIEPQNLGFPLASSATTNNRETLWQSIQTPSSPKPSEGNNLPSASAQVLEFRMADLKVAAVLIMQINVNMVPCDKFQPFLEF